MLLSLYGMMNSTTRLYFCRNFFLACFGILTLHSCNSSESEVIFPARKSISESVYASGWVKAKDQYEAHTLANGPIQELFVSEGDTVHTGDPILQIVNDSERLRRENAQLTRNFSDEQSNQNRLRELELSIELAKSKYRNDSLLWRRQEKLWTQGIGTAVELEQRELSFRSSKSAYESSKLKYGDLKREIEYNTKSAGKNLAISRVMEDEFVLKSKIDGVVFAILREKGEMVNPQTPLAVLGKPGEFILELQVDEYDIAKIEKGQRVMVTMDSFKGQVFEAVVSKIHPIMDSKTKTFTVEALFTKAPPKLYPNLSLEANIVTVIRENALVIPRNLIFLDNRVITSEKDTLEVKLGLKNYDQVEVLEGINENTGLIPPVR
jgi:HlyD family secretion protein